MRQVSYRPVEPLLTLEPLVLVIPWARIVPDNRRMAVVENRMVTTAEYRNAKTGFHSLAKKAWRGRELITGDVSLTAELWYPDARRRDLLNTCKLVCDALTSVCYVDDSQIAVACWRRMGIDRENPRAEFTVTAL